MDPNNKSQIKAAMESPDVQRLAGLIMPSIQGLASIYKSVEPEYTEAEIVEEVGGRRKSNRKGGQGKMEGQPNSGALVYGGGILIILFLMILFEFMGITKKEVPPPSAPIIVPKKKKYRGYRPADYAWAPTPDRVDEQSGRFGLGGAKSRKYRRKRTVRRR
jgi:hypothetical protein